jgi:integrase
MKINRRADGRWCATYRDAHGGRHYVYGKSKADVERKLRDLRAGMTVSQLFCDWLEANRGGWSTKTYESYEQMSRVNVQPYIGNTQVNDLTPEEVEFMLAKLKQRDLSNRTIEYAALVLSRAINWGIKRGKVHTTNPVGLVKLPRVEPYNVDVFTPEQAKKIIREVKGHRLEVLYRLLFALGLRRGEALALRWQDINFTTGTLTIKTGKTNSAARTLPIPQRLITALRQHQDRLSRERQAKKGEWKEHGLVFPSNRGTPLKPNNLRRHYHEILEKAGIPRKRIHDIRHTFVAFLIAEGANLTVIKEIVGHSSANFTSDIYGHLLTNVDRKAIEGVDKLLEE